MRILSTLLMIAGGINWLSVGFLQYDYVAGFFGTQAHIFSRIIYIIIGLASSHILFCLLKNKGKLNLFEKKKSPQADKSLQENQTQVVQDEN